MIWVTAVMIAVAVAAWVSGYLWGQHTATSHGAAGLFNTLDALVENLPAPTTALSPVPAAEAPADTPASLAPHLHRAFPEAFAPEVGHATGIVVFLDKAVAAIRDECTEAYAVGRADQADADDDDPEQLDADDEPDLRECWSCTADRPATDDPCLYCQTPASRWTVGEEVTGHRTGIPGRHGQTGTVERVGYYNNGAPFYYVRWPDTSGRGTLSAGPYGQRELADLDSIRSEEQR